MDTSEIRRRFVAHFERAAHAAVPSASLILDDPTLLFVAAGMVPFKPYFLGQETPPYDRAVSVQKCVRTPDIEDVGKTTRHGTFFEMCGNFSFGDYFKEGAIELAWDLVTKSQADGGFGLEEGRIYPSIYDDDPRRRTSGTRSPACPTTDHPAGQEGELLVDGRARARAARARRSSTTAVPEYGPDLDFGPKGEDRYLEIWNLVFMQDELSAVRAKDDFDIAGSLPKKNIDTGMGLERVAYLLQGVDNMYEIDVMYPVIEKAEELTGRRYGDVARERRAVPGRGRPHPQHDDADQRRRHARQRGPRLRPAPAAAPGGAVDAAARHRGPRAARAAAGQSRQDGRDLHRAAPRLGADLPDRVRRGGRLPPDVAGGHPDLRPGGVRGEAVRWSRAQWRPRVRAARHLRLPHRPDAGDGGRAGPGGRRGRLPLV